MFPRRQGELDRGMLTFGAAAVLIFAESLRFRGKMAKSVVTHDARGPISAESLPDLSWRRAGADPQRTYSSSPRSWAGRSRWRLRPLEVVPWMQFILV